MIGEPNRLRQAMKCDAAGDTNGVARSTVEEGGDSERGGGTDGQGGRGTLMYTY